MTSKQEGTTALTLTAPPSGANSHQPHGLASVSGSVNRKVFYDANGNQIGAADPGGAPGAAASPYDFAAENHIPPVLTSPASTDHSVYATTGTSSIPRGATTGGREPGGSVGASSASLAWTRTTA